MPLIIAHRGDSSNLPENTIPAFENALALGSDGIELDVRLTKDQELVVFHDRLLGRTAPGSKPVSNYTLDELQGLDVGSWFSSKYKGERAPTLDEVLRRHARWNSTLVASFNPISLWELRKIEPQILRGYIWSRRHPFPIRSRCFSPLVKSDWYDPAQNSYNVKLHRKYHSQGARILAWDVEFNLDLKRMAAVRVDGIVTDSLQHMLDQKTTLKNLL